MKMVRPIKQIENFGPPPNKILPFPLFFLGFYNLHCDCNNQLPIGALSKSSSKVFWKMKKGIHPQLQWVSYVTPTGRLINFLMTKIHSVDRVYQLRPKREQAESVGQIAKFNRRYGLEKQENSENSENNQK